VAGAVGGNGAPCPGPQLTPGPTGKLGDWKTAILPWWTVFQNFSCPGFQFAELSAAVEGMTGEVDAASASWPIWATDEPETLTYTLSLDWWVFGLA